MKTNLINRQSVRMLALDVSSAERLNRFSRVSESFLVAANEALRRWVVDQVKRHPSKGKTLVG